MTVSSIVKPRRKTTNENILSNLKYSDFKEIKKIMKDTFDTNNLNENYKLPKILVIGSESTGKSSVLENITKCHIFPRNTKYCTKSPVHIILHDSDVTSCTVTIGQKTIEVDETEIYSCVQEYFNSLNDIVDEEITINIRKKGYTNMELYDLPGICAHPVEKSRKTIELTKKYLQQNNSIILCTIPATETRLVNHTSISLIKEFNRCRDTILVLTMIDRVQFEYLDEFIYDRLLRLDDETTKLEIPFCVGIQNRTHKDRVDLDKMNREEENTIETILFHIEEEYKKYDTFRGELRQSLGMSNLIKVISKKYMQYVTSIWIPKIIIKIEEEIEINKLKIFNIGFEVDAPFINFFLEKFLKNTCEENFRQYILQYFETLELEQHVDAMFSNCKLIEKHIKSMNFINVYMKTVEDLMLVDKIVYNQVTIENLFLPRYRMLQEKIRINLTYIGDHYDRYLKRYLDNIISVCLAEQLRCDGSLYSESVAKLITSMFVTIIRDDFGGLVVAESDLLESDEYVQLRKAYLDRCRRLEKNICVLKKIQTDDI
jgi:GTP-binding protein EngB required for normal cell division